MNPWYAGNSEKDADENRSWLVGHFKPQGDIRYDEDVEVKVSTHRAGEKRAQWTKGEVRRTFFMLMSGRWRLELAVEGDDERETIVLDQPGDYVVWGHGVAHTYEALADSMVITVRWPSVDIGATH